MTKHPEQDLINILVIADLAGIDDEEDWQKVSDARNKLSPEGYKEYEKQTKLAYEDMIEQEKRSKHLLYLMQPDSTMH